MSGIRLVMLVGIISLLAGCAAPKGYVSIEILQPAEVTFPERVSSVAYLNRSPVTIENLSPKNSKGLSFRDVRIIDTMICNAVKAGFTEGFRDQEVLPVDSVIFLEDRRYSSTDKFNSISSETHSVIFNTFPVDALITQDYYSVGLGEHTDYDFAGFLYSQVFTLFVEVGWKLYSRLDTVPFFTYRIIDTLYFENRSDMPPDAYYKATDALRIGFYDTGVRWGRKNVPAWSEVSRYIFIGRDKLLAEAGRFTAEGDWERARELWLKGLHDEEDSRLRAKSAFNLAVYHELEDDLEQALDYLEQAREDWPEDGVINYYQDMETRIENKQRLKIQLQQF